MHAAVWVGLDGFVGSNELVQTGTDSEQSVISGIVTLKARAWTEYVPDKPVFYTGVIVHPGDDVYFETSMCDADGNPQRIGASYGCLFVFNNTTGILGVKQTPKPAAAPAFVGRTAEWIVEAASAELPNYGSVTMTSAYASDQSPSSVPMGNYNLTQYTTKNVNVESTVKMLSSTSMVFTWHAKR
jgi:hypothetical protein